MSRQDTPSNVSSATLQHILYANDQRNTEVQGLLMQNMTDLVQAAKRPVGIPNKLAGGAQPSVKDFREFLESIVSKIFQTQLRNSKRVGKLDKRHANVRCRMD